MQAINDIREKFRAADRSEDLSLLPSLIEEYAGDERKGVRDLCARAGKKITAVKNEEKRVAGMRLFENKAVTDYITTGFICGIDEAGRGPLAGPVAAGAVILPRDHDILYLNDSKKLSAEKRDELYDEIAKEALSWSVGLVTPERIDEINILQATYEAMRLAISKLDPQPEVTVNDAVRIPGVHLPQVPVIKGDAKCISVAAASIMAKVTRDRIMIEYDRLYPEYGFAGNKGYGSADHIEALRRFGPCPIHRRSFIGHFVDPSSQYKGCNLRALGTEKEDDAARYLSDKGITILEHSFRSKMGEIDLIGMDTDGTLVFIEVKYRGVESAGSAEEAVTSSKQHTISRVSDYYRYTHGIAENAKLRFDVIAIDKDGIRWIRNAFPYR
jgi:ribonuclease HII